MCRVLTHALELQELLNEAKWGSVSKIWVSKITPWIWHATLLIPLILISGSGIHTTKTNLLGSRYNSVMIMIATYFTDLNFVPVGFFLTLPTMKILTLDHREYAGHSVLVLQQREEYGKIICFPHQYWQKFCFKAGAVYTHVLKTSQKRKLGSGLIFDA